MKGRNMRKQMYECASVCLSLVFTYYGPSPPGLQSENWLPYCTKLVFFRHMETHFFKFASCKGKLERPSIWGTNILWSPLYSLSAASDQQSKTKRRVESLEVPSPGLEHICKQFILTFHSRKIITFSHDGLQKPLNRQRFCKCRLQYIVCGMQC